jgi:hypothetical protein
MSVHVKSITLGPAKAVASSSRHQTIYCPPSLAGPFGLCVPKALVRQHRPPKAFGFASTLSITATAAHPVMYGTHLADTFSGGAENDTFTGFGAGDTLIFAPGGLADTYRDFVPEGGGDIIDLTAFTSITSLQAVLYRASQSGADTIITLSNADTVTLIGATVTVKPKPPRPVDRAVRRTRLLIAHVLKKW